MNTYYELVHFQTIWRGNKSFQSNISNEFLVKLSEFSTRRHRFTNLPKKHKKCKNLKLYYPMHNKTIVSVEFY